MPVQEYEHHYLLRQVNTHVSRQVLLDSMPVQEYEHRPPITKAVDRDVKQQNKQKQNHAWYI